MEVSTIGLGLAKNVFQFHAADGTGRRRSGQRYRGGHLRGILVRSIGNPCARRP